MIKMNNLLGFLLLISFFCFIKPVNSQDTHDILHARIIAVGIPGAGAVARVGNFISGQFTNSGYTKPGRILDPNRVLVASTSNFGASVWILDPATILSIDPNASEKPLVISPKFAIGGGQVSILDGAVVVLTSNNTAFINSILNPTSITQILSSVSVATGISVDNAYGQIAISSSTGARDGEGWESLVDVQGRPIKGFAVFAGGVFAGRRTNRDPVPIFQGGLTGGSMGTAFLGKSIDGSGHDVFAVANGDGSISQVHLELGVDGLVPVDTLGSFGVSVSAQESWGEGAVMNTRGGMVFLNEPSRTLFVCDPNKNIIRVYSLVNHTLAFRAIFRDAFDSELSFPVDIAPANFSTSGPISNTTLAPGSDFYIANRGNGTIVRMNQKGDVVGIRKMEVDSLGIIGPGRVNGIGLSNDEKFLYVTLTGPILLDGEINNGALVSIPVF
ncbi:MAG: hypothetical protein HYW77_03635 [Parcubacteria group bacterium]|nr:hypothetical protein [Parcubacteria group bacterium]